MKYQIWHTLRFLIVCAVLVLLVQECNKCSKQENDYDIKLKTLQTKP